MTSHQTKAGGIGAIVLVLLLLVAAGAVIYFYYPQYLPAELRQTIAKQTGFKPVATSETEKASDSGKTTKKSGDTKETTPESSGDATTKKAPFGDIKEGDTDSDSSTSLDDSSLNDLGDDSSSGSSESVKSYSDAGLGIKMSYPTGWKVDDSGSVAKLVFASSKPDKTASGQAFTPNINLMTESAQGLSLDEYHQVSQKNAKGMIPSYELTSETPITVGGEPAMLLESTFTQQGYDLKVMQLVMIKNDTAYVITATTVDSTWSKYSNLFETCLKSFRVTE